MREDRHDMRADRRDLRPDERNDAPPGRMYADRRDIARTQQGMRQDWHAYRAAHPDVYRGRAWVGPRGYAYRPVPVGYRFDPVFFDRRYWVDPYRYRLHPVTGSQRWIRYGRDVLLVDTRSGRVLEVNGGFFY